MVHRTRVLKKKSLFFFHENIKIGTGKTTFTISVLCQTLFEACDDNNGTYILNTDRRILVTAPSNKAISVLASRFLKALNGCDDLNMVLIGVEEKLVADDMNDDEASSLKHIFAYTWIEKIEERYKLLADTIKRRKRLDVISDDEYYCCIAKEARALTKKLKKSIPYTGEQTRLIQLAEEFLAQVNNKHSSQQLLGILSKLFLVLQKVNGGDVVDELLATANVIFCTLSSSGVSAMKRTRQVHGK